MRQEETLSNIVSEIRETIKKPELSSDEQLITAVDRLVAKNEEIKKANRNINNFIIILFLLIVSLLSYIYLINDRNIVLQERIYNLEYRDSLFQKFMEPDSVSHTFTYRVRDGEAMTYKDIVKESDSIKLLYDSVSNKARITEIRLGLVLRNYPIKFTQNGNTHTIHAEKIDSALLLLNMFRDRIYYDVEKKVWITTRHSND